MPAPGTRPIQRFDTGERAPVPPPGPPPIPHTLYCALCEGGDDADDVRSVLGLGGSLRPHAPGRRPASPGRAAAVGVERTEARAGRAAGPSRGRPLRPPPSGRAARGRLRLHVV